MFLMQTSLETVGKKSALSSIAIVAVLIAIGAALRIFVPPFFGITPNFVIAMYCLAILLTRPTLGGALAIGVVGGVVCMLTSKSAIPYLNLISEPIGALVAYLMVRVLPGVKISEFLIKPILATFLGTLASGSVYVFITKVLLVWKVAAALSAFTFVVLPMSVINAMIAYVLYLPAQKVLNLNQPNG